MAQAPVKPTTTSKPNPLHGAPPREEVHMHGEPPKSDMAPPPKDEIVPPLEGTKDEMTAGREALSDVEGRTRAELEEGKRIVSRHAQSTEHGRERRKDDE